MDSCASSADLVWQCVELKIVVARRRFLSDFMRQIFPREKLLVKINER